MLCEEVLRIRSGLLYRVQPGDALTETAPQYPDQDFMIVDTVVDEPNVANYLFREQEGSFLMGVLAGRLTETEFSAGAGSTDPDSTTVGFVGGVDSPVIRRFQAGFEAGVDYASDNVDVTTSYVGSYADPSGGQEAALSMYQNGVDIVYHASGATGVGVFQAAQAEGRFAFGVDQDQSISNESFADVILASMVKRVDTAVYESISNIIDDNHQGGGDARARAGVERCRVRLRRPDRRRSARRYRVPRLRRARRDHRRKHRRAGDHERLSAIRRRRIPIAGCSNRPPRTRLFNALVDQTTVSEASVRNPRSFLAPTRSYG